MQVFRSGLTKRVTALWGAPKLVSIDGNPVVSGDLAPSFLGDDALSVRALDPFGNPYAAGGEPVLDRSWSFPYKAYWGFVDVPNHVDFDLGYGEAVTVQVKAACSFAFATVKLPDGTYRDYADVPATALRATLYRQPDDTRTFASENAKMLFWPYQDIR